MKDDQKVLPRERVSLDEQILNLQKDMSRDSAHIFQVLEQLATTPAEDLSYWSEGGKKDRETLEIMLCDQNIPTEAASILRFDEYLLLLAMAMRDMSKDPACGETETDRRTIHLKSLIINLLASKKHSRALKALMKLNYCALREAAYHKSFGENYKSIYNQATDAWDEYKSGLDKMTLEEFCKKLKKDTEECWIPCESVEEYKKRIRHTYQRIDGEIFAVLMMACCPKELNYWQIHKKYCEYDFQKNA